MMKYPFGCVWAGLLTGVWLTFLGLPASAQPDDTVTIARAPWDTGWFQAEVYALLFQELGYTVEGPRTMENGPFYEAVSAGSVDLWANGWFPQHNRYLPEDGSVRLVGHQVNGGAVQGILVDSATAEAYGLKDLADLRDPAIAAIFDRDGNGKADLIGCNRGWACADGIDQHLQRLGLEQTVEHIQGDYSPLMGNVLERFDQGEPVLFYSWTPNWTLGELRPGHEVVWLEVEGSDTDALPELTGCPDTPCHTGWSANDIRAVANRDFLKRNPAAEVILEAVVIPIEDIQDQNARMIQGEDAQEDIRNHAREWIRFNRSKVDPWLDRAREFPLPESPSLDAETPSNTFDARSVQVATKVLPPFVLYNDLAYRGFSIELLRALCDEIGVRPEFKGVNSLAKLLDEAERGGVDLALSAIAITLERERRLDFTHAYFQSGLQILVPVRDEGLWGGFAGRFGSLLRVPRLLELVLLFLLVVFLVAHVIWLIERKHNPQFPRRYLHGVFAGLWWSIVTVTTVGYGDKTPKGHPGKVFALIWLLAGYFVFAYFTASVTTTFTLAEIDHRISSPGDLFDQRVGVVDDSAAQEYLRGLGIQTLEGPAIEERIAALEAGELDAVVHHAPFLNYYATHEGSGKVRVSGVVFSELDYGIALPEGSELREPLNRALLTLMENGTYSKIHDRWF